MADMHLIIDLAAQHRLAVIEHACQARGAEYFFKKRNELLRAGCLGDAAAFSFYPGKNLGACVKSVPLQPPIRKLRARLR
jgi:dTDP-4-amino-4,6-dideoxygalactose transaminase